MAIAPTQNDLNTNLPSQISDVTPEPDSVGTESDLMTGINRLGVFRQVGLMIGLAASVALGLALVLWFQEPNYEPLMNSIEAQDMEEVSSILRLNDVDFKIDHRTGMLLVEGGRLYEAKMKLAAAGITNDSGLGWEGTIFQEQSLGTSQKKENELIKIGLEGELAKSIASFRNIRSARVHLAVPKRSVFVRDARSPSASVLIETSSLRPVSREQVDAIVNLVAGSVPEMDKSKVTVVDQKGNLLSRNDESAEDKLVAREFEYSRKMERVLNDRISSMLSPVLGADRFRSEVSADVDFTHVEETEEFFNPDMAAVRSEQTLDEQRQMLADGGIPGALSNQPPAEGNAPEVAGGAGAEGGGVPTNLRKQTTRNFEVDRTISYTRHQQGRLKRLTVAVAVDDIQNINPETGEVSYTPWSAEELERLTLLVRNAVGYSAARGDSVNVINTPFAPKLIEPVQEVPFYEQSWFADNIWKGVAMLFALIVIFTVIRPVFKNLADAGAQAKELALAGDDDGLAQMEAMAEGEAGERVTLSASDEFLLPGASEGYDRQLNALKGLIAEDPARVAQVIRQWVNADG